MNTTAKMICASASLLVGMSTTVAAETVLVCPTSQIETVTEKLQEDISQEQEIALVRAVCTEHIDLQKILGLPAEHRFILRGKVSELISLHEIGDGRTALVLPFKLLK